MNELDFLRIMLAISDGIMLVGLLLQIHKLRKLKRSEEFSLFYVLAGAVNQVLWTVYGIMIDDWYVALIWCIWLIPATYCSWLVFKYRNNAIEK